MNLKTAQHSVLRTSHGNCEKMGLFLEKPTLLAHPLFRWQDGLSWKMIARHHSKVHPMGNADRWAVHRTIVK